MAFAANYIDQRPIKDTIILITLLIELGVAASYAGALARSNTFKSLLLHRRRGRRDYRHLRAFYGPRRCLVVLADDRPEPLPVGHAQSASSALRSSDHVAGAYYGDAVCRQHVVAVLSSPLLRTALGLLAGGACHLRLCAGCSRHSAEDMERHPHRAEAGRAGPPVDRGASRRVA